MLPLSRLAPCFIRCCGRFQLVVPCPFLDLLILFFIRLLFRLPFFPLQHADPEQCCTHTVLLVIYDCARSTSGRVI